MIKLIKAIFTHEAQKQLSNKKHSNFVANLKAAAQEAK